MDIRDVVKSIMETDVQAFVLYRSMTNYRSSVIITRRLNELIADEPDLQDVAVALAIYPALKWSMHGADADVVMSRMCKSDEELRRLGNVQKVLVAATGFEPRFLLENRKRYFDACSELIRLLEKAIKKVGEYPNVGKVYQSILKLFLMDSKEEPTKYIVNRYVKDAVRLVYECYGEEIEELLDVILSGAVLPDDEMAYVYHNITLLLKEYNRIVWRANNSDDRALRLLSCETEDEMLEITSKDEKYRQAYLIVEYIKFINGAIEMVKSFPVNGKEYYDIIKTIVDLKPQNISDEVSSRELGMSTYTYSVKKRRALSVLSSILWGCDGDAFVRLLTDAA